MTRASDAEIWDYAGEAGFVIVSKDNDFQQMSFVFGSPPKVIWIRRGNCSVQETDVVGIGGRGKVRSEGRFGGPERYRKYRGRQ